MNTCYTNFFVSASIFLWSFFNALAKEKGQHNQSENLNTADLMTLAVNKYYNLKMENKRITQDPKIVALLNILQAINKSQKNNHQD